MQETSPKPVYRFTSVLTARSGKIRYFRSPGDVPVDLQRDLEKALHGDLTANVVLADEGGQKYLQSRPESKRAALPPVVNGRRWIARRLAIEAVGAAAIAMALWLLAGWR